MAAKQPVWGIDVGQCSLKAIKLQAAGDGVEMVTCDVVEHPSILSEAESDATAMVIKSIETFASRNDLKGAKIVVSVPGQQTLTRFTKLPPVDVKKIPDMVQYEASQQIPFDLDEVVWDYQVFQEKDSPDVEVGIFAIRKELIRNYIGYFTDHGIEPFIVQTSPMASYNAARYEEVAEAGKAAVLLDMGALGTDLIVMEGERIWSRQLRIGGNQFTKALVTAFKTTFRKAEKLKRTAATSKYARQVFQAMRPAFADLVSEIQRSIGSYTSTRRDAHVTRVVGMGNAFLLPGLQKFLQQNLQIQVDRLSQFKKMTIAENDRTPQFKEQIMSFTVAYGLALQGLGLAPVGSNLIPLEVKKSLLWKKKQPWFYASAASLALAAGSLWVSNVMATNQIASAMGSLTAPSPIPASSVDDAMARLNSIGSEPPLEKAAKVAGAAQKLQSAFSELDRKSAGDMGFLNTLAKLPQNNILVPRILETVHEAFAEASPQLTTISDPRALAEAARQTPRAQRQDVWIERIDMIYDPKDPAQLYGGDAKSGSSLRSPGWYLRIVGGATDPSPAKWLEQTLIKSLDENGKKPGRGFYFDNIKLDKVINRQKSNPISSPVTANAEPTAPGGRLGRGGARIEERSGTSGMMPRGGRGAGQPTGATGAGLGRVVGGTNILEEATRWRNKFVKADPVTGEDDTGDKRFIILVCARKGDTPEKMIPERYRPKPAEVDQKKKPDGGG